MPNLRKQLASALTGASLFDDPNREVAVDRLRAHAHSDPFGGALWSLRWANNAGAYGEALRMLEEKMTRTHKRDDRRVVRKVCRIALDEWLRDVCKSCKGRRYIQATALAAAHVCTLCEGSGLARISDQDRMRALGVKEAAYNDRWVKRLYDAHQRISEADTRAWMGMAAWLGQEVGPHAARKLLAIQNERGNIPHVSDIEAP